MDKAIERVCRDMDAIHLSFDMHSLKPRYAPGVETPIPAGLTQREAHLACEMVAETGELIGMDIVDVNTIHDV
jgi:arginase